MNIIQTIFSVPYSCNAGQSSATSGTIFVAWTDICNDCLGNDIPPHLTLPDQHPVLTPADFNTCKESCVEKSTCTAVSVMIDTSGVKICALKTACPANIQQAFPAGFQAGFSAVKTMSTTTAAPTTTSPGTLGPPDDMGQFGICKTGWTSISREGGRWCLKRHDSKLDWNNAKDACRNENGKDGEEVYLALPIDANENDVEFRKFTDDAEDFIWIGCAFEGCLRHER